MAFVEELLNSTSFEPKDISIATPYAAQVRLYKQAFEFANTYAPFWQARRNIFEIKVSTVDSLQGAQNKCIIFELVVSRTRMGGLGFVTDTKRMNVALTHPEDFLVVVGDRYCNFDDDEYKNDPDVQNLQFDDDGQPRDIRSAYAKNILDFYHAEQLLKEAPETSSLAQATYVDLEEAEAFRKVVASKVCANCQQAGRKRKDCTKPKAAKEEDQCRNCKKYGHFAINCQKPEVFTGRCRYCNEVGHRKRDCRHRACPRCGRKGHVENDCEGEDIRFPYTYWQLLQLAGELPA